MTTVRYESAIGTTAGAIPVNTEVATHPRAGDGASVQDVYIDNIPADGYVSSVNSTETNLAGGAVFEGTFDSALEYGAVRVAIYSSHVSAASGLEFWCSKDGTDGFIEDTYTIPAGTPKTFAVPVSAPYFKIRYTNGATQTTTLKICVMFQRNVSVISSHRIGDTVTDDDDATLVQAVLKAKRPGGTFENIAADVSGNLFTTIGGITQDAGGRVRISQLTTLGDYKILNADRPLLLETVGTGTGTFQANKYNMAVTSGQWMVRQSRRYHPYFSGKSQMVETTFDGFGLQANVVKRVGAFSSNAVSPYDTTYDGIWLENTGTTYVLKASRAGTETVSVDWTDWDNYDLISGYNFDNFTVILFDYLWLGGAVYRLWIKNGGGFVLLHTVHYAGTSQDVFIQSPNQPIRYEIRSTTGSGSFRYICSQVSTEGSINESGLGGTVRTAAIATGNVGTTYPLLAIRKGATFRDIAVAIEDLSVFVTTTQDQMRWSVQINPTLSAPLTYAAVANSAVEVASGNGTITVTTPGTILVAGTTSSALMQPTGILKLNFLSFLGGTIANVMDQYVLCGEPITNAITSYSTLSYKEI